MPDPVAVNPWVLALVAFVLLACTLVWYVILVRCLRNKPILQFEPRSPVPWGAGASLLALTMVLIAVWNFVSGVEQPDLDGISPLEMATQIATSAFLMLLITTVAVILIGVSSGASWRDLGLPGRVSEFIRDGKFGFLGWLATMIPVYGTQALLIHQFEQPSNHPLLKMLLQEPTPVLIIAGFLMAVIVAPICEELAFRLFLQGCLEKWETARVTANSTPRIIDIDSSPREATDATFNRTGLSDPSKLIDSQPTLLLTTKPPWGIWGLPYGWVPIGVSSFLFAFAHLGHGPDPVAIFFLAIFLGYTYHQTHRILPCIITHMLFNGWSMGMLLTQILHKSGGGL
jgi:membrane protease YdiL (CAAX protease family)